MRTYIIGYSRYYDWIKYRIQFYRTRDLVVVYEIFKKYDDFLAGPFDNYLFLTDESWNEFPNGGRTEY